MKYKILVDSCTDLPIQLKTDSHFKIIPLTLIIDDKIIVDNEDFNQKEFLNIMNKSPNSPKSACPSPEDYMREFEGDGDTYVVTISSELSGSYNSALLAKKLYLEEHPSSNKKIEVIEFSQCLCGADFDCNED